MASRRQASVGPIIGNYNSTGRFEQFYQQLPHQQISQLQMTFRDRRGELFLQGEGVTFKDKLVYFEGTNLVGRNPAKTTITIKDKSISEIHAKIICKDGIIKVMDNKSKNGVYLNSMENPITPEIQVEINPKTDVVYFGQIRGKFVPDNQERPSDQQTKQFTLKNTKQATTNEPPKNQKEEPKETIPKPIPEAVSQLNEKANKKTKKDILDKNIETEEQSKSNLQDQELEEVSEEKKQKKETKKKQGKKQSKDKDKSKQEETKKEEKKDKSTAKAEKNKDSKVQKYNSDIEEINLEQKAVSKKESKEKQDKKEKESKDKKDKKQHKSESGETKVKGNQKRKNKSMGKAETEQNKNLLMRKKLPDNLSQSFSNHPRRSITQKKILISGFTLGFKPTIKISVVQNWRDSYDILVMDKYARTFKLLYTICLGLPVVTITWVVESEHRRGIVPLERFYLHGPSKELIPTSVERAKSGFKVFAGLKFYLVQSKQGFHLPIEQIVALIEAGGGQISKKPSKKEQTICITRLDPQKQQLKSLLKQQGTQRIYTVQLILDSCLHQHIKWNQNKLSA